MRMDLMLDSRTAWLALAVLGCLWALSSPSSVKAQNPSFRSPVCTVQSVGQPPPAPAPPLWQIKGTVPVNNLPAGTMNVTVKVEFWRKAAGAANWVKMFDVSQSTTPVTGTASIDTGFQNFTPSPAQGEQFKVIVSGSYTLGGPPAQNFQLNSVGSLSVIPIP
jgi:hypothetical protein